MKMSKCQIEALVQSEIDLDIDYSRTITLVYRHDNDGYDFTRDEQYGEISETRLMNKESWFGYLKDGVEYEVYFND